MVEPTAGSVWPAQASSLLRTFTIDERQRNGDGGGGDSTDHLRSWR